MKQLNILLWLFWNYLLQICLNLSTYDTQSFGVKQQLVAMIMLTEIISLTKLALHVASHFNISI